MIRRPPRSTRTDTLFPYTTLFRSELRTLPRVVRRHHRIVGGKAPLRPILLGRHVVGGAKMTLQHLKLLAVFEKDDVLGRDRLLDRHRRAQRLGLGLRSEDGRLGKECVSTCSYLWSTYT